MKEIVKTTRWINYSNTTAPARAITVYEVWSGLNKIGTYRRRKSAKKRAK